jgi:hypothetical protein
MNQTQKIIISVIVSLVIIYCGYWAIEWMWLDDIPSLIGGIVLAGIFNVVFWRSNSEKEE